MGYQDTDSLDAEGLSARVDLAHGRANLLAGYFSAPVRKETPTTVAAKRRRDRLLEPSDCLNRSSQTKAIQLVVE